MSNKVKAYKESLVIPTYQLGKPEINPLFFEKRVYQGSSGKVYPVPFIDKVYDHKEDVSYDAAILENDQIRLVLLPEIGGRIFEAQDKTNNDYNFFYQQKVIKPALVGLAGPWISGGVEFNWPQHHRPGTYLPTDSHIEEEADGAKTVWMSEYDPIRRLKGMHGIRIRPGSSLIELRGRLFNRTPLTETFLWWANVAVEATEDYESFFPPDVHYVADHAVRAMSSFPEAENDYYGIPYHKRHGKNDLRKYDNIPVPTSYMVCDTKYDFFGGYDFKEEGGFIHVANRHIAPGKKQWTWGNKEFGKAWDRELTDEGGPYLELMAGVYTDNQPDFTYLYPYETKTFSQFWWSYKKIGPVQNANKDLAIRVVVEEGNKLDLGVAASSSFENLTIIINAGERQKIFSDITVSPETPWIEKELTIEDGEEHSVALIVIDNKNRELISFTNHKIDRSRDRNVAFEPKDPKDIDSPNELELVGEHLELYRHPTRYPEPYWEEAIKRDPQSYKSHISLGRADLKSGKFSSAENYFRTAINIMTSYHPNPASGEAHYFCGLTSAISGKLDEAYSLLYKATWDFSWRAAAYYRLATLDCIKNDYSSALGHIEASLDTNRQNNKAIILKAIILKRTGRKDESIDILDQLYKIDPLDQWAEFERATLTGDYTTFIRSSRNDAQTVLDIVFDYAEAGFYQEAIELIDLHHSNIIHQSAVQNPMSSSVMTQFTLAWLCDKNRETTRSREILEKIAKNPSYDYLFPSRIDEQVVLEWALATDNKNCVAAFGLGNYLFNLKRHKDAIKCWEIAAAADCNYGTLYRNLGIAYWNSYGDGEMARNSFIKAVELSPDDLRIQYEFDQLRKKLNDSPKERLEQLLKIKDKVSFRDDLSVELAALYNFNGQYNEALALLESKNFHPWEGGEGQVLKQFSSACIKLGQEALLSGDPEKALALFNRSINTPDNLGEKYHPLQAVAHINYWKGMAYKAAGDSSNAKAHFTKSTLEEGDFIDMAVSEYSELSYYKALSLQELGEIEKAKELLLGIEKFANSKLLDKNVKIDYFATSLPLLLVFEDDIDQRNQVDAKFLMALAKLGLGDKESAIKLVDEILEMNSMHVGASEIFDI